MKVYKRIGGPLRGEAKIVCAGCGHKAYVAGSMMPDGYDPRADDDEYDDEQERDRANGVVDICAACVTALAGPPPTNEEAEKMWKAFMAGESISDDETRGSADKPQH